MHCGGFIYLLCMLSTISVVCPAGLRRQLSNAYNSSTSLLPSSDASSMPSRGSTNNLGGCPKLTDNCNFDCITLDGQGCLKCTCAGLSKPSALTGGSTLTSSGSSSSSSSQSPSANTAGFSLLSSTTGNTVGTSGYSGGTHSASNAAGCPKLPSDCNFDCLVIGNNGCISCTCQGGNPNGPLTSSTVNQTLSTGASNPGGNGCPSFPTNCRQECAYLGAHGCPICDCASATAGMSGSNGKNLNQCPPFPTNCRADCLDINSAGCPLCSCTSGSNSSSNSGGSVGGSMSGINPFQPGSVNTMSNCPSFSSSCPAKCTNSNSNGCPVCTCTVTDNGNSQKCPPLIANCNIACLWRDNFGCVLCNGNCNDMYVKQNSGSSSTSTTTNTTTGGSSSGSGICSTFDPSACPARCSGFDSQGCLICTCSGSTLSTKSPGQSCPVFDSAHCDSSCLGLDGNGCLSCDCGTGGNTANLVAPTATVPMLPNGNGTGTISTGGQSGTRPLIGTGCPAFDIYCPSGCAIVDDKGCLKCTCRGSTQTPDAKSTHAPGITNNCPAFDTSCRAGCAKVDARGCLSCSCQASTQRPVAKTTAASGFGNVHKCPAFDTACPTACGKLDARGCLICSCSARTTQGPSHAATRAPTTKAPKITVKCPSFSDNCPSGCTALDALGCLQCTCTAGTTQPVPVATLAPAPL